MPGPRVESGESQRDSIYEIAKKRFNLDKEQEQMKFKRELETLNAKVENLDDLL